MLATVPAFASDHDVKMTAWETTSATAPIIHQPRGQTNKRHDRDERQDRGQQPHQAHAARDGLRELRKIGVAERLGRSHQVNQAVQGDDEREDPAHADSSRQAGGTILPDAGTGRASVTR